MRNGTDARRNDSHRPPIWHLCLLAAICLSIVSCVIAPDRRRAARQRWDKDRGPVVPHDTFPSDCSLCHAGGEWQSIRDDFEFDHERETGVPLRGAHDGAQCLRCHNDRGSAARFATRGCAGCHQDIHRGQLGARCNECHGESTWVPEGQVVLHNRTRFPLAGAHTAVACFQCHPGAQVGNYLRAPVDCEACHRQDAAQAVAPDHAAQGWTHDCSRCHTAVAWDGAGFDHSRFPLTGAHTSLGCSVCHANGVYTGLSQACVSCHQADYLSATSPNHVAGNFSTDCRSCHNTVSWRGALFDHNGIAGNCSQCHLPAYNATTDPNHVAGNFSTECQNCHNTASWRGATFDHNGIAGNCSQCHLPAYNATTDPNHAAAGFPTNCEACHGTNAWRPATFTHTFNIASGPHAQFRCAECHQVANNYSVVSCTHCHEHSEAKANDKHSGVTGYSWSSPACIGCHPTGR